MSLRIRANDMTAHCGWFFLLRAGDQQMLLEVNRGGRIGSFPIRDGHVMHGEIRVCTIISSEHSFHIERPDSLIEIVQQNISVPA